MSSLYKDHGNKLVFISGMHGTGKNSLIEDFLKEIKDHPLSRKVIFHKKIVMTTFEDNFDRQARRIAKYFIDYKRMILKTLNSENPIVLCDRSILDYDRYIEAFRDLGYLGLDLEEYEAFKMMSDAFNKLYDKNKLNTFYLEPSYEFICQNILKRKNRTGRFKWREDDDRYNSAIYKSYVDWYKSASLETSTKCTSEDRKERVEELVKFVNRVIEKSLYK